eukprot:m.352347 g.352347  ORF g.352347 m.352347 type:complete len:142 (-) comp16496_c0_seq1:256-681(-)
MASINVCTVPDELKAALRKFRFRKATTNGAIVMKVNMKSMEVEIDEEYDDCTLEEVAEDLPEFAPRYIVFSYCHRRSDGRVSYPLVFLYYCPGGVKPEMNMIYAGTKTSVINAIDITKSWEIRDAEDITEEWLLSKLEFFG